MSSTSASAAGAGHARARTRARQTAIVVSSAIVAGVMLVLGIWQMAVYRNTGEARLRARADAAPVALDAQLASGVPVGDLYGRQVRLHGHYLSLRPQLVGRTAPYRVLQPFQDGTRVIGVVRGTVNSPTASVPAAPAGEIDQAGIMMPSEASNDAGAPSASASTLPGVNLEQLAQSWPPGVVPGFISLSNADASAQHLDAAVVAMPNNASGRAQNLGYAVQWWVFAVCALAAGLGLARTVGRRPSDPSPADADTNPATPDDRAAGDSVHH